MIKTLVWNDHKNDIGDWCPWSDEPAVIPAGDTGPDTDPCCPARCRASRPVDKDDQ